MSTELNIADCRIELIQGDITRIPADAIVNAANSMLAGGGGVDDAIHRAAGPTLMQELSRYDGCATGSAVVTSAGRLPAKFVFHAVGPVYAAGDRQQASLLAACYRTCLQLAQQNRCRSISFPAISTGVYRYPISDAASVALSTLIETLPKINGVVEIKLVQFNQQNYQAYWKLFEGFQGSQMSAQTS